MKKLLLFSILFLILTELNAQGWGEIQKIVPDDRFSGQQFGAHVAIDDNYAVVGVLVSNVARDAYVYENDGSGNWVQLQKLESPDPHQFAHFGTAVAIDSDYIFIGSWGQHYDANGANYLQSAGAVYIFKKQTSGLFEFEQKIVASDREALNAFGYGIALNGDYAIVSPFRHDFDASGNNFLDDAGAVYLFERDGNGIWSEVQKIVASDRTAFDYFGQSALAIDGNYAIIGSYGEDEDAIGGDTLSSAGSVYIFERDVTGTWNEVQKILALDRKAGDVFGWDVAISGNQIVIGAYGEDIPNTGDSQSGAAYVFERDGNGTWNEVQKIVASDRASGDRFGYSVAIDNNNIIIGAYLKNFTEDNMTYSGGGRAYIFKKDVTDNWKQAQNLSASDRATNDYFGYSVSLSGNYAIVGAYPEDEDENGMNFMQEAGSVYIYDANEPTLSIESNDFYTDVKAYPNPMQDILNIDLAQYYTNVTIKVANIFGQKIVSKEYTHSQSIQLEFYQPKGVYLVEVKAENKIISVLKVVKY